MILTSLVKCGDPTCRVEYGGRRVRVRWRIRQSFTNSQKDLHDDNNNSIMLLFVELILTSLKCPLRALHVCYFVHPYHHARTSYKPNWCQSCVCFNFRVTRNPSFNFRIRQTYLQLLMHPGAMQMYSTTILRPKPKRIFILIINTQMQSAKKTQVVQLPKPCQWKLPK